MIGTGHPKEWLLGRGKLTWNAEERRSDRYGTVWLMESGDSMTHAVPAVMAKIAEIIGKPVKLMAEITETRQSTHIGDLFRGIFPRTPNVGDLIVLGEGIMFIEWTPGQEGHTQVGLTPYDGRTNDWLNPRALYDCHEQTVDLIVQLAERES